MKFIKFPITFLFLALLILEVGCDKCQDCDPLDTHDPGIYVTFIANTEIAKVENSLVLSRIDSTTLSNSVKVVLDSLELENLSEEERVKLTIKRDELNVQIKAKNESISSERNLLKDLKEGQTIIDELHVVGSPTYFSFNRNSRFRFTLRPDTDSTMFKIVFNDRVDSLTLYYQKEVKVEDNRIKVKAKNITIGKNTFKNIELDTTNILNETWAKIYY